MRLAASFAYPGLVVQWSGAEGCCTNDTYLRTVRCGFLSTRMPARPRPRALLFSRVSRACEARGFCAALRTLRYEVLQTVGGLARAASAVLFKRLLQGVAGDEPKYEHLCEGRSCSYTSDRGRSNTGPTIVAGRSCSPYRPRQAQQSSVKPSGVPEPSGSRSLSWRGDA